VGEPSAGEVVVVAVAVVLNFQVSAVKEVQLPAGEIIWIPIVGFIIRVGCEVRLEDVAIAVGIVFVTLLQVEVIHLHQGHGAEEVVVYIDLGKDRGGSRVHHQYFVYIIPIGEPPLRRVRTIVLAEDLPSVVIVVHTARPAHGLNTKGLLRQPSVCVSFHYFLLPLASGFEDRIQAGQALIFSPKNRKSGSHS